MNKNQTIIGIDGGATKISGAIIKQIDEETFTKIGELFTINHSENPLYNRNYLPAGIDEQIEEMNNPKLQISEERQGSAILENFENMITNLTGILKDKKPLIGIGIPGVKSTDKRGIIAANNGPRIPRFLDVLERRLTLNGFDYYPINNLGNDSDYCGMGELYSEYGAFREINNGLFIGSGTGISDAIMLDENLISFDDIETWMPKTWQLKNEQEIPIESLISHNGLMLQYSELTGIPYSKLEKDKIFPEQFLKNPDAIGIKAEFVSTLSDLILQRIESLFSKISNCFFDKIVLGLRLVNLLNEIPELFDEITESVKKRIINSQILNQITKINYVENNTIVQSKLPDAPVIGAGISAYYDAE